MASAASSSVLCDTWEAMILPKSAGTRSDLQNSLIVREKHVFNNKALNTSIENTFDNLQSRRLT